ncbi:Portal vertex protein [Chromobacterium vaccinii]|nr:Portal vertex protein [Chromobacterium vaccinii]QND89903.1 Portal vertex protein [Chromobacterium vaccinii]
MAMLETLLARLGLKKTAAAPALPGETIGPTSEAGRRATPENQLRALYRRFYVDYDLRATIQDIRQMDQADGRVKRIHARVARDVTRGGLVLLQTDPASPLRAEWDRFTRRLQLNRTEKLKSDARGLLKEGNLPMQWVLDATGNVVSAVRMPTETMRPNVGINGQFLDPRAAYTQMDLSNGVELATFPLWQLTLVRLDPENFDDMGALGRPFLDASREIWRKLRMTDTDLVIRRKHRAPLRLSHVLEGATQEELQTYQDRVEANAELIQTDFYLNKKGAVTAVQGDAALGEIQDVLYLLDSFFAGTPLPKGLMGYTDGMARDILEDLKRDYYDEVDQLQDTLAWVYEFGFRLQLLLKGINPDAEEFKVTFAERRTETATQTVDRALKLQALGLPHSMVWEEVGYNPATVEARRESDAKHYDPYPEPAAAAPTVKVTPGNGRKGESATDIGHGR